MWLSISQYSTPKKLWQNKMYDVEVTISRTTCKELLKAEQSEGGYVHAACATKSNICNYGIFKCCRQGITSINGLCNFTLEVVLASEGRVSMSFSMRCQL